MKYIIADPDEQSSVDLKIILDKCEIVDFKGSFTTIQAVESSIREEPSDIIFIRMGSVKLNAFKLASVIRRITPFSKVIFFSGQVAYAVDAFECAADGFLLLPFDREKIENLMLRSIEKRAVAL